LTDLFEKIEKITMVHMGKILKNLKLS